MVGSGQREKKRLLVRGKENNLRFPCRINFHLTCPDDKIGCEQEMLGGFLE